MLYIHDWRYTVTKVVVKSYNGEKYELIGQNIDMGRIVEDEIINLAEAHMLNYLQILQLHNTTNIFST